jgi:hypothetical protein
MKTFPMAVVAAFGLVASTAHADVIDFTDSLPLTTTDWFQTLTVSQFDPTLGTLNSAKVSFSANMLSDMTLDNDNATPSPVVGNVSVQTFGTFAGIDLGLLLAADTGAPTVLAADDSGDTDLPGDGGADEILVGNLTDNDMIMATLTAPGDLGQFLGAGTISTVNLFTLGGFGVTGGGGNVDVNVNTQAAASLFVEYDFTPAPPPPQIPVPATLALLGLGLAGLGVARRRR